MFDLESLTDSICNLLHNPEDSEKIAVDLAKLVFEYDSHPYEHSELLRLLLKERGLHED